MMNQLNNPKLTPISKTLRKNMTTEEKHLWYDFLKKSDVTFHRQKVIGNYIADFYCASAKLIIELDGSGHNTEKGEENDRIRDEYFNGLGIAVLRFPNYRIKKDFWNVCEEINCFIESRKEN